MPRRTKSLGVSCEGVADDVVAVLDAMAAAPLLRFCEWGEIEPTLPTQPGVYTIWDGTELLYAGKAAGRGGLRTRLSQHATGNNVESDFCRYAWQHDLRDGLATSERHALADSRLSIRDLVQARMVSRYTFRVATTASVGLADSVERELIRGAIHSGKHPVPPRFNPPDRSPIRARTTRRLRTRREADAADPADVWAIIERWRALPEARTSMLPSNQSQVAANLAALADAPETSEALQRVGIKDVLTAVTTSAKPDWIRCLRRKQDTPGHYARSPHCVNALAVAAVWAASRKVG